MFVLPNTEDIKQSSNIESTTCVFLLVFSVVSTVRHEEGSGELVPLVGVGSARQSAPTFGPSDPDEQR